MSTQNRASRQILPGNYLLGQVINNVRQVLLLTVMSMDLHQNQNLQTQVANNNLIEHKNMLEIKNGVTIVNQKIETVARECMINNNVLTKLESKLASLQKIAASHSDKLINISREKNELKEFLENKNQEQTTSIEGIKKKTKDLERKVVELERRTSGAQFLGGNISEVPPGEENLKQLVEDVERQLSFYSINIAEMELRFKALEHTSNNGAMIWKIENYQRKKQEAISGRALSFYSKPFYTSQYGYKMCSRIYLNGDGMGKGTHISLFFVVMKGEYDALLPWPFRQKVTLMLMDQGSERRHLSDTFHPDPSSSSFKKPVSDMNIASGCPLFVAHNVAEGGSYVENDSIYIKIKVEITNLENI